MAPTEHPFLTLYLHAGPMLVIAVLIAAVLLNLPRLALQVGRGVFVGPICVPRSAAAVWSMYQI